MDPEHPGLGDEEDIPGKEYETKHNRRSDERTWYKKNVEEWKEMDKQSGREEDTATASIGNGDGGGAAAAATRPTGPRREGWWRAGFDATKSELGWREWMDQEHLGLEDEEDVSEMEFEAKYNGRLDEWTWFTKNEETWKEMDNRSGREEDTAAAAGGNGGDGAGGKSEAKKKRKQKGGRSKAREKAKR